MAKNKPVKPKKTVRLRRVPRVRRPQGPSPYQSLLADPCTSLPLSPYGGERGIVERFVSDVTFGAATHTCGIAFVQPAANAFGGFTNTSPSIDTIQTSASAVAGGFFVNSVQKARPIAACLELIPASLSITNITGELAMAVFDCTTVGGGLTTSVDKIFALSNDREVLRKQDYEIKWYPGNGDEYYNTRAVTGGTLQMSDPASQNAVVIAWRGIPAGTLLSFRITIVYEWTPIPGLGLAATSAPARSTDWKNQSAALHESHPNWWTGKPQKSTFASRTKYAAGQSKVTKGLYAGLTDYDKLIPMVVHAFENGM